MLEQYPAKYRDEFGKEETTIQNDGKYLRMTIRDVEFESCWLDDWEPMTSDPARLINFRLNRNMLCAYALDFNIPVPIIVPSESLQGDLHIHFELDLAKTDAIARQYLQLELIIDSMSYRSSGKSTLFELELQKIQKQLPEGLFIKCCFGCAFSDYNPAGNGLFGGLACFRNNKQEYL